jgi:DNA-binding transcriptional ArsR family regulator
MFRELIPLLAERYRVIAPDHLGFGLSDAPSKLVSSSQSSDRWAIRDEDLADIYPFRALDGGDVDISKVAALLADHARSKMLLTLASGRAMTASKLAATARITPATASSHLKKLTEAGFLKVEAIGRERFYRLSGPRIAALIETLESFAPAHTISSWNDHAQAKALRAGRACYDHVGGRLGVAVMSAMITANQLNAHANESEELGGSDKPCGADIQYSLTGMGREFLTCFGASSPRRDDNVRYCTDWSEIGHHLSGDIGRALFRAFLDREWIELAREGRALKIRPAGRLGFEQEFGIQIS